MSTLNIKNFPDDLYALLRERAETDRRSVAQQVIHLLERALRARAARSLLELRGLGSEVWRDVDATAHVDEERRAWD